MARRTKSSAAETLVDLIALLPWWAAVCAAALSYLLLHSAATQPASPMVQPGQIASAVGLSVFQTLASAAQYFFPAICLAGAAVSYWRRRQRQQLVATVLHNPAGDALDGMTWQAFERVVGEGFRLQGYSVSETGGGGADGGVDLVLSKPGQNGSEKFLVQCKQWRAHRVGVDVVRELYGVMAARGATGGFVVTSGRFSEEALKFASGRNISLMDGPKLLQLIQSAGAAGSRSALPLGSQPQAKPAFPSAPSKTCPICSKPMQRRVAKRGANAGSPFWGCTGFPECRGTRPIA